MSELNAELGALDHLTAELQSAKSMVATFEECRYLVFHPPEFTTRYKQALLACFAHVAWTDANGQSYYNALRDALYFGYPVSYITAVFTQGDHVVYEMENLNTLKQYLVVTATYANHTSEVLADTDYTLSGVLSAGTSTITVTYDDKTTTFDVTVTSLNVTDVLCLDGIRNTRNGHSVATTTWYDLSGHQNDFTKLSGASDVVWGADHAAFDATNRVITLNKDLLTNLSEMTFEAVIAITGNGSFVYSGTYYGQIFGNRDWDKDGGFRLATYNATSAQVSANFASSSITLGNTNIGENTIAYVAVAIKNNEAKWYVNGDLTKTTTIDFPPTTYRASYVGGYKAANNNTFYPHSKVFRLGISSTAYDADTIADRLAFYQERFNFS